MCFYSYVCAFILLSTCTIVVIYGQSDNSGSSATAELFKNSKRNKGAMLADVTFPSLSGEAAQPPRFQMYTHDISECFWISKQLVQTHQWEPFLVLSLMQSIKAAVSAADPKPLFVDIGTNIGAFSMAAGASGATVISIEPLAYNTELYLESIKLNNFTSFATLHKIAMSDSPNSDPLCLVPYESYAKRGNLGNVKAEAIEMCLSDTKNQTEIVPVTTLDMLLPTQTVTAIKIDIEGHEYAAMSGAKRLLGSDRAPCHIQFEYVHFRVASERGRMFTLLEGFGYKCQRQHGNRDEWTFVPNGQQPPQGEYRCFHTKLPRCAPVLQTHQISL